MFKKFVTICILVTSSIVHAGCPELYPENKEIAVPDTVELCNSFYVVRYSVSYLTPVLVSERLDPSKPIGSVNRVNSFRADPRILRGIKPSEYVNTGFDKGHMAPADDASSEEEMRDTFLMTNMTPQSPRLNQQKWRMLEEKIRKEVIASKQVTHVITVAVYDKRRPSLVRLSIPTGYWKITITPKQKRYWFVENKDGAEITELKSLTDVDLLKITQTLL